MLIDLLEHNFSGDLYSRTKIVSTDDQIICCTIADNRLELFTWNKENLKEKIRETIYSSVEEVKHEN